MTAKKLFKFKRSLLLGTFLSLACQPIEKRRQEPIPDEEAGSIPLTITAAEPMADSEPDTKAWLVSCGTEKFLLDLVIPPPDPKELFTFSTGRLCRYQETEARQCLDSITRALEARRIETPRERSKCLPFQTAILGQNLNRNLSSEPQGTWLTVKAFVADGEGEFYLKPEPGNG